jgi:type IV pilus assembly protein PilB
MPKEKYLRLGEILINEGLINATQLEKAIDIQKILVKLGMVKEDRMVAALGRQLNIPYFSLGTGMLKPASDQELQRLIPRDFAIKSFVLPLSRTLNSLTVAMADPLDLILIDNLKKITGCEVNPVIATCSDILRAVEGFYGKQAMLKNAVDASYDTLLYSLLLRKQNPLMEN